MAVEETGGLKEDRGPPDEYIIHHEKYQVVVCISCGACIVPGLGVRRHYIDYH